LTTTACFAIRSILNCLAGGGQEIAYLRPPLHLLFQAIAVSRLAGSGALHLAGGGEDGFLARNLRNGSEADPEILAVVDELLRRILIHFRDDHRGLNLMVVGAHLDLADRTIECEAFERQRDFLGVGISGLCHGFGQ
jgi:hypothetical protein